MLLDSARSLKLELLDKVSKTEEFLFRTNLLSQKFEAAPEMISPLSFGVASSDSDKEYGLAVRVSNGFSSLLDFIKSKLPKNNELDLAVVDYEAYSKDLRPGNSCGHFKISAGTLGGFVQDRKGKKYILSNNHVIANSDQAETGDQILSPGPYDVPPGQKGEVIGRLTRWVPLETHKRNAVDAAIAEIVNGFKPVSDYEGFGAYNPKEITDRFSVKKAIKRGRTTKVTKGVVTAYELDGVTVNYRTKLVTFDGLIEFLHETPQTDAFGLPGDSGSVIFSNDPSLPHRPYALLFAGGPDHRGYKRTLANFMPDVLKSLDVKFI